MSSASVVNCGTTASALTSAAESTATFRRLTLVAWCCPYCFHSALPFADCSRLSSASAPVSTLSVSDTSLSSAATLAPPPSTGISLYLANSRSLIPKMDDLCLLVSGSSPPSIIALTETWLDSSIRDCEVSLPSYELFRFGSEPGVR